MIAILYNTKQGYKTKTCFFGQYYYDVVNHGYDMVFNKQRTKFYYAYKGK